MIKPTLGTEWVANRRLLLPFSLAEQIEQQAERAFPEECCGILMGVSRAVDVVVHRIMTAENIAVGDRRKRYQIDWESLFQAIREPQDSPEAIVGFYHSHPDGSCQPSWSDHREAWIDYAYLIAGVSSRGVTDMGCWRVHQEEAPFVREIVERIGTR